MASRRTWTFRPTLCVLEDRTAPATFRSFVGPTTQLQVIVPTQVQAGASFMVKVVAKDVRNQTAPTFKGPVQISLGTTDAGATLPASYVFTPADAGVHMFQVTLGKAGRQTIVARNTPGSGIAAGAITMVKAGPATQFLITAPSLVPIKTATSITVTAMDAFNNVATTFTGPIQLSASNSNLPANYTFVAKDLGKHTFKTNFTTAGVKTVSASNGALTAGQASVQVYVPGLATHFSVQVVGPVYANMPTLVQVVALDAVDNIATGYLGVVRFSSNDGLAALLGDYGFTSSDAGVHVFRAMFGAPGTRWLTATDMLTPSLSETAIVNVVQAPTPYYGWGWNNWGWNGYYW